MAPPRFSFA